MSCLNVQISCVGKVGKPLRSLSSFARSCIIHDAVLSRQLAYSRSPQKKRGTEDHFHGCNCEPVVASASSNDLHISLVNLDSFNFNACLHKDNNTRGT